MENHKRINMKRFLILFTFLSIAALNAIEIDDFINKSNCDRIIDK